MRRQRVLMVLAAACAGVAASAAAPNVARAAAVTWDGPAGGLWSDDANWAPDGPVAGNDAKFAATGAVTSSAGTVTNVVGADATINSLAYNHAGISTENNTHTTQINHGVTLTLNGSSGANGATLYVGNAQNNSLPSSVNNLTFANFVDEAGAGAGGTLAISNPLADIHVRQTGSATGARMATLNLYGLSNFVADIRDLNVAVGDPADAALNRAQGTMYLAKNNTISANSINVGVNVNNGTTANPTGRLFFGNTNVINTNSITIGGMQTPSNSAGFNPATTSGALTVRGAGGIGRADLFIGAQLVGVTAGTSTNNNVVDFNGGSGFGSGSVDMRLNDVVIGRAGFTTNAAGTARNAVGTLTFGAGTIDANTVTLGDDNATANAAQGTGTLNVNNAAQLVVNQNLTLGRKTNAGVASGTLNINGATAAVRVNGPIVDGGGASTITVQGSGTLQANSLGSAASRIDAVNVTDGSIVLDLRGGLPAGGSAWGHVSALNPSGANPIAFLVQPGTLSDGQTIPGINYATLGGGGFASFTLPKAPARTVAHLVNNANSVDIVIDDVDTPRWNGTAGSVTGNDWDIATSDNWQLIGAGTATTYQEDLVNYSTTDAVTFDDNAANTNVEVTTTVAPSFIAVNNPTKNYTFGGAGKITGATGILKTGGGTLTIGNTGGNDFSGTINVQGGTLATSASNVLPDTASVAVATGATFALGDFSDTVDNVAINAGSVTVNNGALTAGTLAVGSGSLAITGTGSVSAGVLSYSGGTFSIGGGSVSAQTLNLSNGVTLAPASGTITATTINIDNATLGAGNVTPAAINVTTGGTIDSTVSGVAALTKTGAGTLTISGNNTYTGATRLDGGILILTHGNALGGTGGNTLIENGGNTGNGYLGLSGGISVPEPITIAGRRGFTPNNSPPYNFEPHIRNVSGNNTITGDITLFTGGTNHNIGSDAGKLTIAGDIINSIDTSPPLTRFLHLRGAAEGEISGDIRITGSEQQDIIKMDAGTWTISGADNAKIQKTTVEAGTLAFAGPRYHTGAIDVQGTSGAAVAPGGGSNRILRADTVTIAAAAKIDLGDNKLITNSPAGTFSGTAYTGIQGEVQRAYNFGAWDLPGLTTSMPNAGQNAGILSGTETIAVATAEQVMFIGPTDTGVFQGQTVTGATTIAMYTYAGDLNMDGLVDGADYGVIDNSVQFPGTDGYVNGDFNYDGVIDGADYGIIDNTIQLQGAPFPGVVFGASASASGGLAGVTAVPEPSACGFAILGAAALLRRCRRREVTA